MKFENIPDVPVIDQFEFARRVGVSVGVVQGWIAKRHLPVLKIGRRSLVNVAALRQRCLSEGSLFIESGVAIREAA